MNLFQSLVLGIVEGLTEFLPVSSTFHLIFTAKLLGLAQTDYLKLFEVVIQSGAVAALLFIYTKTLLTDRKLIKNLLYSFVPTAIIGFLLHNLIKDVFFESKWLMLGVFMLMGLVFLLVEKYTPRLDKTCMEQSPVDSLLIGLAQATSVIPGVSRAGSVIVAMMMLGYKREEAARYTFLLSIPTIFAATALDLYKSRELLPQLGADATTLFVGFVTAFVVAFLVVKWFTKYLRHHTLRIFAWYRFILSLALLPL